MSALLVAPITRHRQPVETELGVITHNYFWDNGHYFRHELGDPETIFHYEEGGWKLFSWGSILPLKLIQSRPELSKHVRLEQKVVGGQLLHGFGPELKPAA
jgi:hypothetical protein